MSLRSNLPSKPRGAFVPSLAVDLRVRERAILVTIVFRKSSYHDDWPVEDAAQELKDLAESTGASAVWQIISQREAPTPAILIGTGKAEEIAQLAKQHRADVVIFNQDLSFAQQRNLEQIIQSKVIDRTQLILDLFAQRARSQEGKVQVELAQHQYLLPRLAGEGIWLSRLGGGIGTRGPGEQKLEMDRRRIRNRIVKLKKDLELIRRRRGNMRRERRQRAIATATLVGYTNAGKTTLFNALTNSKGIVQDQLFTTLDPMSRRLKLPTHQLLVLSDTVGFLHQLPHHLIEAFHATLEEVVEAHLLLHVVDSSSPLRDEQIKAVEDLLQEITPEAKQRLIVMNKMDLIPEEELRILKRRFPEAVFVSALKGEGLPQLLDRMIHQLSSLMIPVRLILPQTAQHWLHRLYQEGAVLDRKEADGFIEIHALVPPALKPLLKNNGFFA
ncbi:MAG: GTPase HflX [Candidatus Omnitrophica bacterium]|nr:GTPase HflX [Candidatus Omnitrophota bacterium]